MYFKCQEKMGMVGRNEGVILDWIGMMIQRKVFHPIFCSLHNTVPYVSNNQIPLLFALCTYATLEYVG